MFGSTLTTMRRVPPALRLRLQTAYAQAWEALIDTHQTQAMMFVRRMADRLSLEDALSRYFHEVPVPAAMQETVRSRALLALADSVSEEPPASAATERRNRLRPDWLMTAVRRRAQFVEETTLHSRMAACVAEGAVAATHIRMAVAVAELLAGVTSADQAVMVYVRSFDLPVKEGDTVFRGALAELARRRLPASESPRLQLEPQELEAMVRPAIPEPVAPAAPAFGLRVIV
ncbi:MAG TPA: hypothetical protein VFK09_00185 [Gemmatimonadales bacterium]|nr:hypothetical protein [Gemmatimonadales bacterium]